MLTNSTTDAIFGVGYFPHDDRFLYTSDKGGNELDHLYVMATDGTSTDLTPGDEVKARFAGWSGDRKHFYVETNERKAEAFDVYRYATDGYQREMVFQNDGNWGVGSVSRDGRWLSLDKPRTNADSDIYLADLADASAKPKHITPHEGDALHNPAGFTPDSAKLLYSTDAHGEFTQIWTYDIAAGRHELHTAADWDIWGVSYSETGKYMVTWINEDAKKKLGR